MHNIGDTETLVNKFWLILGHYVKDGFGGGVLHIPERKRDVPCFPRAAVTMLLFAGFQRMFMQSSLQIHYPDKII